jgi:hypothetical protein
MTNTRAIVTALLCFFVPVFVCALIVFVDEGVKFSLFIDFVKMNALFFVIGIAISAFFLYREGQGATSVGGSDAHRL